MSETMVMQNLVGELRAKGSITAADVLALRREVWADGIIKPEMVANLEVPRDFIAEALVVPQEALVRTEDGFIAFVVTERDGHEVAEVRPVEIGASQRNTTVVTSGLEEGDQLVVVGQGQVADGDRVNVVGR